MGKHIILVSVMINPKRGDEYSIHFHMGVAPFPGLPIDLLWTVYIHGTWVFYDIFLHMECKERIHCNILTRLECLKFILNFCGEFSLLCHAIYISTSEFVEVFLLQLLGVQWWLHGDPEIAVGLAQPYQQFFDLKTQLLIKKASHFSADHKNF